MFGNMNPPKNYRTKENNNMPFIGWCICLCVFRYTKLQFKQNRDSEQLTVLFKDVIEASTSSSEENETNPNPGRLLRTTEVEGGAIHEWDPNLTEDFKDTKEC
jgi:hypothetical protein